MGRNIKKGIDYFSHDVNMLNDRKIKLLKAKHGLIGYAIYLRLLETLYDENGYYLKIDDEFNILFIDDNNIDENTYINCLNDCINYNLFNKKIYDNYSILTSKRIQYNYFSATERRKSVEIIESLLLIEIVNDNINVIDSYINPQSKVKESKGKKRKEDIRVIDFKLFSNYWNENSGLSTIIKLSDKRKTAIKNRIKEFNEQTIFDMIDKVKASDFLQGKKTDWKADFDFCIKAENFIKIMEGNYDENKKKDITQWEPSTDYAK